MRKPVAILGFAFLLFVPVVDAEAGPAVVTDHWGGVRGLIDDDDVSSGRVEVIAPRDFMEHTISENVLAGNAMNRRLFYQYGLLLPVSPHG